MSSYACGLVPQLGGSVKRGSTMRKSFSSKHIGGTEWHIRTQFTEQLKTLDAKLELDTSILAEVSDYYKRRAEVEKSYADQLNSLAKTIRSRHTNDVKKREYVAGHIWQVLVGSTTELAQEHRNIAEVLETQMVTRLADIQEDCSRIHHQTRESLESCQRRILNSMSNLQNLMGSYYDQMALLSQAQKAMLKAKKAYLAIEKKKEAQGKPVSKSKRVAKAKLEYETKLTEFENCQSETSRARNEYLLQLHGTNSGLSSYFEDEIPDYMDCFLMGFHNSVARSLLMHVSCEDSVCATRTSISQLLQSSVTTLEMHQDKATLLEKHPCFKTFMPFEFQKHKDDEITTIYSDYKLQSILANEVHNFKETLQNKRLEIDEKFKTLQEAEKSLMELIDQRDFDVQNPANLQQQQQDPTARKHSIPLVNSPTELGAATGQPPSSGQAQGAVSSTSSSSTSFAVHTTSTRRSTSIHSHTQPTTASPVNIGVYTASRAATRERRIDTEKFYLTKFNEYVDLKHRRYVTSRKLEVLEEALKTDCYQKAASVAASVAARKFPNSLKPTPEEEAEAANAAALAATSSKVSALAILNEKGSLTKPSWKAMHAKTSPKLFGGTIEEYVKHWSFPIPPVVTSCIRVINLYGMNHQGIFRVPGSQVDMNMYRERFERLEDPFEHLNGTRDINAVAGVLKMYFRELAKAPFPPELFEEIRGITRKENTKERVEALRDLVRKRLSKPVYVTMRYLFAFLKHLSEHSDENMMDAVNLSICFGPGIIAIPEQLDPVQNQGIVNDTVRNLIEHFARIFVHTDVHGPMYDRFTVDNSRMPNDYAMTHHLDSSITSTSPGDTSSINNTSLASTASFQSASTSVMPQASLEIPVSGTSQQPSVHLQEGIEEEELEEDVEDGGGITAESSEVDTTSQRAVGEELEVDGTLMTMSSQSSLATSGSLDMISTSTASVEVISSHTPPVRMTQDKLLTTNSTSPPTTAAATTSSGHGDEHSSTDSLHKLPTRLEPDGEESLGSNAINQPSDTSEMRPRSVVHLARMFESPSGSTLPAPTAVRRGVMGQHSSFHHVVPSQSTAAPQLTSEQMQSRYRSLPHGTSPPILHSTAADMLESPSSKSSQQLHPVEPVESMEQLPTNATALLEEQMNAATEVSTQPPQDSSCSKSLDEAIDSSSDPARLDDSDFAGSQSPHSFLRESSNDDEIEIDSGLECVRRQLKSLRLEHSQSARSVVFDSQSQKLLHLPSAKHAPDLVLDVYAQHGAPQSSSLSFGGKTPGEMLSTTAERFANEESVTLQRRPPGSTDSSTMGGDQPPSGHETGNSFTDASPTGNHSGPVPGSPPMGGATKLKPTPPVRSNFPQPTQTHFTQL